MSRASTTISWPSGLWPTRAPSRRSTSHAVRTSASFGTLRSTLRSGVSSVANRSGSAAFLAPLTSTSPSRALPPWITIVSTSHPSRFRCRRAGRRSRAPPPPGRRRRSHRRSGCPRRPRPASLELALPPSPSPATPRRPVYRPLVPESCAKRTSRRDPRQAHSGARGRGPPGRGRRCRGRGCTAGWRRSGRSGRGRRPTTSRPAPTSPRGHAARGSAAPPPARPARGRMPRSPLRAARVRAPPRSHRCPCPRRGCGARAASPDTRSRLRARSRAGAPARGDRPRGESTRTPARPAGRRPGCAPPEQRRGVRAARPPTPAAARARARRRKPDRSRAPPRATPLHPPVARERRRRRGARWRRRARSPRPSARHLERFGLSLGHEGVDDRVEIAVEDAIELMQRDVHAVVRDPALRKVVRADLPGAIAGADHGFAVRGDLLLLLLARPVEQARAQDLERLGLVLVLRLLVLAGHDQVGGQMGHPDGRVGRVDALPARARRPIDVDAQVLLLDRHVDLFGLREHGHRHRGGVDATLRLGRGHALYTVDAAFELEAAEGALPLHERDHLLEAAEAGPTRRQRFHLPPVALGVAAVHAIQVGSEERRFVAARAGTYLDHRVALVVRIPG